MISEENDLSELIESVTEKPVVVVTKAQQKQLSDLVSVVPVNPVVIATNEEYAAAGAWLVTIKQNIKQIDAIHDEIAGPLDEAMAKIKGSVTKLKAFFNVPRQKLLGSEAAIKEGMRVYLVDQEARRAAAQKLLDDAAAKEKARVKALADAAAKKAAEAEAELRRQVAKDAAAGKAQEAARAKEKADKLAAGASVRADIAAAKIASLDAPVVAYEAPKAAGVTSRKTWTYEVYDEAVVPREYLMLDDKKIQAAVANGERMITGLMIKQVSAIVGTGK